MTNSKYPMEGREFFRVMVTIHGACHKSVKPREFSGVVGKTKYSKQPMFPVVKGNSFSHVPCAQVFGVAGIVCEPYIDTQHGRPVRATVWAEKPNLDEAAKFARSTLVGAMEQYLEDYKLEVERVKSYDLS